MATILFTMAFGLCAVSIGSAVVGFAALFVRHMRGTNVLPQLAARSSADSAPSVSTKHAAHAAM